MSRPHQPHFAMLTIVLGCMSMISANPVDADDLINRSSTWSVDGTVFAIASNSNTTYIGGSFSYFGPNTGTGAPLDRTTGIVPGSSPEIRFDVYACVADGNGGWYIGGRIGDVGGVTRRAIAHILNDGSLDLTWDAGTIFVDEDVFSIAIGGGVLFVGAEESLTHINAATGSFVRRIVAGGGIRAVDYGDGVTYVGGGLVHIGGEIRTYIAALQGGSATTWAPAVPGPVYALKLDGDTLYVGGQNFVASINTNTADTNWTVYTNDKVLALVLSGESIFVGGEFFQIGGEAIAYVAQLEKSTGSVAAWSVAAGGNVAALEIAGNTLYVGGLGTRIAAVNITTSLFTEWQPKVSGGYALALAISGNSIYAGGNFNSIGGLTRNNLAAVDTDTGAVTDWDPNANSSVQSVGVSGATVYAGGWFTTIAGQSRNHIAALDADTGAVTDWDPNANSLVQSVGVSGATVYAGGRFTSIGGQSRNRIAALDATTGNATAWNPDANVFVHELALSGNTVYIGGEFTSIGGQSRNYIAALDATTGDATAWNPDANYYVYALAVSGDTVYAGGWFNAIGGQSRNRIAALDATTGDATAWNPDSNNIVYDVVVSGTTVYAGGDFTTIGGQSREHIAALDATTGDATTFTTNVFNSKDVHAININSNSLYVGGEFDQDFEYGGFREFRFPGADIWIDFGWTGNEDGAYNTPFNTLAEGIDTLNPGGIIYIRGDSAQSSSEETLSISKPAHIFAVNGQVSVGTDGAKRGAIPKSGFASRPRVIVNP